MCINAVYYKYRFSNILAICKHLKVIVLNFIHTFFYYVNIDRQYRHETLNIYLYIYVKVYDINEPNYFTILIPAGPHTQKFNNIY